MNAGLALVPDADAPTTSTPPAAQPALLVVDDDRLCVEANEAACDLLAAARSELLGRRFDDLLAAGMAQRLQRAWAAFAAGAGHAGPFTLAGGGDVQLSLTRELVTGRHLLVLSPLDPAVAAGARDEPPRRFVATTPPGVAPARPPSARESEVLALLATGATDPEIARMLALSPATVQTHVRNAKAKLGARTRAQAVAIAIGRDLISLG